MAEGTRSYSQVVDSLNSLREQQDRHQKQLEDTIAVLLQQQENARIDRENQDKRFAEVLQQISKISINGSNAQEEMHDDSEEVPARDHVDRGFFRNIKVEFPRFSGGNPVAWVYKANQYFLYHQVPPGQRIFFASFYMEEEALVWFQNSSEAGLFRSWDEFTQALQVRFGLSVYDDPMEALTRLKQLSAVAAYKTEFELISNRLKGISEKNKLSCFISGLKDEVRFAVKMFNPKNLNDAFGLAKIQEQNIWSTRKVWKNTSYDPGTSMQKPIQAHSILGAPPRGQAVSKMPFQRISENQMQERRKKGLCYFCEEKYYQGHKCAKPRVYVLEGMDLSHMEPCESEEEPEQSEENDDQQMKGVAGVAAISVQALVGTPSPKTMRVLGHIKKRRLTILIDSGSTHNFVDTAVASKCGLAIQQSEPLQVRIANDDLVASEGKCCNVPLLIQGTTFLSDLLTLKLGGCDIVLGVQWLLSLGPILWDFGKLSMQFTYKGVLTCLKALTATSSNLVDDVEVTKISSMENKGLFLQITAVQSQEVLHDVPQDVLKLLDSFQIVFDEPRGLPPQRSQDHQILLKTDTTPVSVRPYRYPYYQKTEIEKIVKELLESGVIRPSQSPFSSPVLLVRKGDGSWQMYRDYRALNEATIKAKYLYQ
ncbi:hypothetical protein F2P56_011397 [Juglans regia]|uniref:Uncharacterized protein LOC108997792 n=2 Tax=Juglans regia TaxID=51240 RepID=A0A2I4FDJ6_JUGRE|nr:uncharacterized protein LOC108997792 [Juglans regia]KAF5470911.1 hypothetical protein F2P56_011397 [Juglans regia]